MSTIQLNEAARVRALHQLEVLDSASEREFDALVQAAALVCGVPISLISLIDTDRQWIKANFGMGNVQEVPRNVSFCAQVIEHEGIMEIPDATIDPRFADNPFVKSKDVRFYAGATLRLSDGAHVGSLCVIDREPQRLSQAQRIILDRLATATVALLEMRRMTRRCIDSEAKFRALTDSAPLGVFATDANDTCNYVNARWQAIYDLSLSDSLGDGWHRALHPHDRERILEQRRQAARSCTGFDLEFRVRHNDGMVRYVRSVGRPIQDAAGNFNGFIGSVEDVTQRVLAQRENEELLNAVREHFSVSITDAAGTIIEVNDAFCTASQYNRVQLIGSSHQIVNSGHHHQLFFDDMWRRIESGQSWRGEICNQARDGSHYWVDCIVVPLLGTDGRITRYLSLHNEITQRKAGQNALRKSLALLNQIGTLANIGGWEFDPSLGVPEWSNQVFEIYGVEHGRRVGLKDTLRFCAPEVRLRLMAAFTHAIATGDGWDLELPSFKADGTSIWVRSVGHAERSGGKVTRLLGALQDITSIVQQRHALEAAHHRLALATESGGIGVWDYDVLRRRLDVDQQIRCLYDALDDSEISPMRLFAARLHPDDAEGVQQTVDDALRQAAGYDHEFRIVLRSGCIRHLRSAARISRDAQGRPLRIIGVNWDVTAMRQLTADLAGQHELLRVTLQSIGDAVITSNAAGEVNWLNPTAERMTGWSTAEAVGRPIPEVFRIVYESSNELAADPVSRCLNQSTAVRRADPVTLIARAGDSFGIEDSAAPICDKSGAMLGAVLVFRDVTEQRRLSGEMKYRATHDALTGLLNRAEFEACLRHALVRAKECHSQHTLLCIDLDRFKLVNDACGHAVGDQLLQQVADLLRETVRARDTLARLGGDEFAVILEHCTAEMGQRVAQQICTRMDDFRFIHNKQQFRIGTSIGLVPFDNRWSTPAAAMQAADSSCYAAKEAGRNRVHAWFETDLTMQARRGETQWVTRLEQAMDEDRFALYVQKIESVVEATSGLHAEVLLRLIDTDGSIVLPGAFLPAAERFHLSSRLDQWVLRRSIETLAALPDLTAVQMLCVNLSGQSVGDRAFHQHAIDLLTAAGRSMCQRICVEITETAAVTHMADAAKFIEQLRALGVRIALDDFGAGASSFGYLKRLKVDLLKIDGQFIKDLIDDPLDDAAVRCFVNVAKVIGVKTVAEFVERPQIQDRIRVLGIDYAQGFLLHRPEPIERVLGRLLQADACRRQHVCEAQTDETATADR